MPYRKPRSCLTTHYFVLRNFVWKSANHIAANVIPAAYLSHAHPNRHLVLTVNWSMYLNDPLRVRVVASVAVSLSPVRKLECAELIHENVPVLCRDGTVWRVCAACRIGHRKLGIRVARVFPLKLCL